MKASRVWRLGGIAVSTALLASLGVVGPAEGTSATEAVVARLAPVQKGIVVVKIRTPEGVPGVVRLQKAEKLRVVTKDPAGTVSKVRVKVPIGKWSVLPRQVLHDSAIFTGAPSAKTVMVRAGEAVPVTVTYQPAPSATDLQVTRIDRSGLDLSWQAPSPDAEYAVRMAPGYTAPRLATEGSELPVTGTTASTTGLSPATAYAFSVFARRPGTQKWWGPVSTSVTTPSAGAGGQSAAAVTNPATVLADPSSVPTSVRNGEVTVTVPAGITPTVGQPWVLPVSDVLPGGYVGVVSRVSPDGTSVVLVAGGLADAFDYLDIKVPDLSSVPTSTLSDNGTARPLARAVVGVDCSGSFQEKVIIDPSMDPFGHFNASLNKYEIVGKDVPLGMSFDTRFGVNVGVSADVTVTAGADCKLDLPAIAATIMAGPVPIVVKTEPIVRASVYGRVEIQNLGFQASLGATVEGYLGLGGEDYVEGDLIASATPHRPTIETAEAGLRLTAGVKTSVGPGVGTPGAGAMIGISASLNALDATATPSGGLGCIELNAISSANISLEAKAWLGDWSLSRSVTVPGLDVEVPYAGSPWHLPSGCGGNGDEYRITEGTLDVTHSWSGGCSNDQGGCDDGPDYTSTHSFSESSAARLKVAEPGPWVQQWESSRTYLSAPMTFDSWSFDADAAWRSSGYGCSWSDTWETTGAMQFANAYWETGATVLPGPELSLDGKLSHYYYYDDWSEEWTNNWWGSLGAWDTDYSNGFPKIDTRYTYTSGGECASEPYTGTSEQTMEHLSPGYWWYWPEESRRSSSTSTSTPLEPCTPEACRWRVDGTDTYQFRSDYADYGYQGSGSATVNWSYVIERRRPVSEEPAP
jgi:hypothetical protein